MRRLTAAEAEAWRRSNAQPPVTAPARSSTVDETGARLRQAEAEARERGYRDGLSKGMEETRKTLERERAAAAAMLERERQEARKAAEALQSRLAALLSGLDAEVRHLRQYAEQTAVEAAYAAVARFVGERYADGSLMGELAGHALECVPGDAVTIRVSEQDLQTMPAIDGVAIVPDRRLQPGCCVIDAGFGRYEAGLDVKLNRLRDALLAGLRVHRAEEVRP